MAVDALTLLTLRMGFSLPFFLLVPFVYKKKDSEQHVRGKDWIQIILLGTLGYYVASIFDFMGLEHVTAGLERLILFVYPTIVVLLSALFFQKPITKHVMLALALTYTGVIVIFSDSHMQAQENIALGATYIFISAFTYAAYLVGSGRLIPKFGSITYNAYSMIISCMAVIVHFLIARPTDIFALPLELYGYGMLIALISTVIPTFLIAEGLRLIGPSKASIIASVGPVITIFLGFALLGEKVTVTEIIGTLFVIGGVIWISYKR